MSALATLPAFALLRLPRREICRRALGPHRHLSAFDFFAKGKATDPITVALGVSTPQYNSESSLLARDSVDSSSLPAEEKKLVDPGGLALLNSVNPGPLVVPSNLKRATPEVRALLSAMTVAIPSVLRMDVKQRKHGRKGKRNPHLPRDGTTWNAAAQTWPGTPAPQLDGVVYKIVQDVNLGTIFSVSNSVATFGAVNFTISTLDQVASFSNVFDQYKIDMVELWVSISGQTANTGNSGRFVSVIDYDDSANLTTFNSALDYTNAVVTHANEGHYRRFRPHIAVASYSGTFTSYTNIEATWIDILSTGVQHYGVKFAAEALSSVNTVVGTCRFHCSFRAVR